MDEALLTEFTALNRSLGLSTALAGIPEVSGI
jgi:hypothetical protein